MLLRLVIGWTCVGVFIATAIVTLLAMVKVVELADKKYLDRLFTILIVEVIIVGVGVFTGLVESPAKVEEQVRNAGRVTLAKQILPDVEIITTGASGRDPRDTTVIAAQRVEKALKKIIQNHQG